MMQSRVLGLGELSGGWRLLRVQWSGRGEILPGQWLLIRLGELELRLAVMQTAAEWLACLVPPAASAHLADTGAHAPCELEGPFGGELSRPVPLILGTDAGIGAALLAARAATCQPRLVVLGSSTDFPFRPRPSRFVVQGAPAEAIGAAPMLEEQGVPSRLAQPAGLPGCFEGDALELLAQWWQAQPAGSHLEGVAFGSAELGGELTRRANRLPPMHFCEVPHPLS